MKPNQLRDGNWIKTKPDAPFVQDYVMKINTRAIANYSEHYLGVPLVDHLDKVRIQTHYKTGIQFIKIGLLYLLWATDHFIVSYEDGKGVFVDIHAERLYFVHELQNLHLCLTNSDFLFSSRIDGKYWEDKFDNL